MWRKGWPALVLPFWGGNRKVNVIPFPDGAALSHVLIPHRPVLNRHDEDERYRRTAV